jgi:Fe-S-cluster containining protein
VTDQCRNCVCFKAGTSIEPRRPNLCRRYPPQTHYVGMTPQGPAHSNVYPSVEPDGWCYEHKRKDEKIAVVPYNIAGSKEVPA